MKTLLTIVALSASFTTCTTSASTGAPSNACDRFAETAAFFELGHDASEPFTVPFEQFEIHPAVPPR